MNLFVGKWIPDIIFLMVVGGGFEPPKAMLADLQSAPFSHSGIPPVSLFNILPELRFYNWQTIFFSIIFTDISQKTTDGGVSRPISRLAALASSGSIAFRRDKRREYKYALSRRSLAKTDPRSSCLQNTTLPHDPSAGLRTKLRPDKPIGSFVF